MNLSDFKRVLAKAINFKENRFHPLVWINGNPKIGENVYIGGMSEVNAKGAKVVIGDNCDIASFVAINCADSHKKTLGIKKVNDCKDIILEDNVFVGSNSSLVAPIIVEKNSIVGAGSVITKKVKKNSLALSRPIQIEVKNYKRKK